MPPSTGASLDKYELRAIGTTRLGRFMRRTHLDELPQLWSVALGTMSLVGPRPEMPHLAVRFSPEQVRAREPFRPGCLGLWQVSVHRANLMHETPEYDIVYANGASLSLDLYIIWRWVRLAMGHEALRLSDLPSRYLPSSTPTTVPSRGIGPTGPDEVPDEGDDAFATAANG